MKRAVKVSMIGLGVVLAVISLAVIIFASTFDLNDYKDRIARVVMDETGRTLTFDGDLNLEFFPRLGVSLGGVSLSNAKGFADKNMVRASSGHVSVKLFPLIFGKVQFGHLELDGLTLSLSRHKNGVANWDDLVGRQPVEEKSESDKKFSLNIDGVTVRDASLAWNDEVADVMFVLRDISLETGQIYEGAPFPVRANMNFDCTSPQVSGKLHLSGKSSLDFKSREYGHMDMTLSLDAQGKDVPGGKVAGEMALQFLAMNFAEEHAQITGLTASAYGATVHLDGSLDGITNGIKKVVATLNVDSFDARKTLKSLGMDSPDTADKSAFGDISGMADILYAPHDFQLKSVVVNADGCRIAGSAQVSRVKGEPFAKASLDIGTLDLDRYLPKDHAEKTKTAKEKVATGEKSDRIFHTKRLRRLHLDLEAKAAKLRVEGAWLENVHAKAKARYGEIHISPLSADLYGGSLSSGLTINAKGKYPRADLIVGLNKVDIGALSQDMSGKSAYAGILDFNAAVSASGERMPVLLRSMDGKISFHLADGVFPGVNLIHLAKETDANKGKKGGTVEGAATDSTKFGSINGTGVIKSGVLRNKDLEIKAPGLRANGEGAVVLPTQQLDYLLKVKLVPTGEGQGGKSSDDLYGIMVPIRVGGTIENPRYWVSITEYVKALGGAVIGTAGSILGGAVDVLKGVGNVVTGGALESNKKEEAAPKKKRGLFDFF